MCGAILGEGPRFHKSLRLGAGCYSKRVPPYSLYLLNLIHFSYTIAADVADWRASRGRLTPPVKMVDPILRGLFDPALRWASLN